MTSVSEQALRDGWEFVEPGMSQIERVLDECTLRVLAARPESQDQATTLLREHLSKRRGELPSWMGAEFWMIATAESDDFTDTESIKFAATSYMTLPSALLDRSIAVHAPTDEGVKVELIDSNLFVVGPDPFEALISLARLVESRRS